MFCRTCSQRKLLFYFSQLGQASEKLSHCVLNPGVPVAFRPKPTLRLKEMPVIACSFQAYRVLKQSLLSSTCFSNGHSTKGQVLLTPTSRSGASTAPDHWLWSVCYGNVILSCDTRHRAEIRAKVYHMGIKALRRASFAICLKTGLIWLISCRASRRATVECGFQTTHREESRCCTSCFPAVQRPKVV